MPDNLASMVLCSLYFSIAAIATILILIKAIRNRFAPTKTVKAEVIGKHTVESFSKYSGNGKSKKYAVVFSTEGKEKGFYVSSFSYDGYHRGEKGMLTYKGDKLISFK